MQRALLADATPTNSVSQAADLPAVLIQCRTFERYDPRTPGPSVIGSSLERSTDAASVSIADLLASSMAAASDRLFEVSFVEDSFLTVNETMLKFTNCMTVEAAAAKSPRCSRPLLQHQGTQADHQTAQVFQALGRWCR